MIKNISFKSMGKYLYLGVVTILFLLIFGSSTSPLYASYGQDSAVFIMIGKSLLKGIVPYRDLFENKGPLLYFIQGLPQIFIPGRLGVWIMQILVMFASLILLCAIIKMITNKRNYIITSIVFFGYLTICYEGGNLSEEYSLFFSLIAIYVCLKYLFAEKSNRKIYLTYFIIGISLASVISIRINDSVLIIAASLSLLFYEISTKRYVHLFKGIILGVLGMATIIIPIVVYYKINNAFQDMIYGYLKINSLYVGGGFFKSLNERKALLFGPYGLIIFFVCLVTIIAICKLYNNIICNRKIDKKINISILIFIIASGLLFPIATLTSKSGYLHYLIVYSILPVMAANIIIEDKVSINKYKPLSGFLIVLIIIYLFNFVNINYKMIKPPTNEMFYMKTSLKNNSEHIKEYIKPNDSVYSIGIYSSWYYANGLLPSYKHFLLTIYINIDPKIKYDFEKYMVEKPPTWLVINEYSNYRDLITDKTYKIIHEKYKLVYSDEIGNLYRKID